MRSIWKAAAYVVWVGVAAVGGYRLMTAAPGTGGALFLARPPAHLWVLALAAEAGLWAAVAPFLWRSCREFGPDTARGWAAWLLIGAAALALVVALGRAGVYGPPPGYPLAHHAGRIQALTVAALILLGPGILTMWLIWRRLSVTAPPDGADWPAALRQARDLLTVRERLAQVLLALGLAVGAATLATGALRTAVLAYRPQEASQFPATDPWLYGAGATLILAAGYFPAYIALQRAARHLAGAMYPVEGENRPSPDWYAERTNFIGLLQLETGPVQSFRAGVAILAPLAGSLLGILVPAK